jgi:hypothetical protein
MMMTDVFQSTLLIVTLVLIPVVVGYFYGDLAGAGDSFGFDCKNYFVLNCTQAEFKDFGSPCASDDSASTFQTGCVAYAEPYKQLHPAVDESAFYTPLTRVRLSLSVALRRQDSPHVPPRMR